MLEHGHAVTAVTRQSDPAALRGLDVRLCSGQGPHALSALAAGHDLIVDAAAPYPLEPSLPGSPPWRTAIASALDRTHRVLEAALSSRARLVFISSFTTLRRPDSFPGALETTWRRSAYPYFEAKALMEQAVLDAAHRGWPALIVNPAACLGPWEFRGDASSLVRLVLAQRLPVVMDQNLSVLDVRDLAEAIDRALARELFGRPIPIAGHNLNLVDLVRQIRSLGGVNGPPPTPIDPRIVAMTAYWTSATLAAFGQASQDLWRAVPLIADAFPMQPSSDQIAMALELRPLSVTLGDTIAFHRAWRPA
jgi:dihydroflavonol-4-reductase